jgi:hypothetical protein
MDEALKDPETSLRLIEMALAAGEAFPEAVATIRHRTVPPKRGEGAVYAIRHANMFSKFPEATLELLDFCIDRKEEHFYKGDLKTLLESIETAWEGAAQDQRFRSLSDFSAS